MSECYWSRYSSLLGLHDEASTLLVVSCGDCLAQVTIQVITIDHLRPSIFLGRSTAYRKLMTSCLCHLTYAIEGGDLITHALARPEDLPHWSLWQVYSFSLWSCLFECFCWLHRDQIEQFHWWQLSLRWLWHRCCCLGLVPSSWLAALNGSLR